ncbi:hypothetical protein [Myroides sp. DF42-4-2]|uniref:hypothetical protein n=1 Tax=unclassified Myroides TaxID=2642485 RepID=UPI002577AE74|nr:hypothetical protein [Myroides sp. DF42-4-2]MDM1408577.1 hypothetical protein [Myroides sp. DF42-4-2]
MKKLMIMGAFLLSAGAFAQSADIKSTFAEYEKQGYIQIDSSTMYNPVRECWVGLVFGCDENGERDDNSDISIKVTSFYRKGIDDKQREYCETGTIANPRECNGI